MRELLNRRPFFLRVSACETMYQVHWKQEDYVEKYKVDKVYSYIADIYCLLSFVCYDFLEIE